MIIGLEKFVKILDVLNLKGFEGKIYECMLRCEVDEYMDVKT